MIKITKTKSNKIRIKFKTKIKIFKVLKKILKIRIKISLLLLNNQDKLQKTVLVEKNSLIYNIIFNKIINNNNSNNLLKIRQ